MEKIRLYLNYKHTEEPWGGANNFQKLLVNHIKSSNMMEIVDDVGHADVVFLNQLSKGPNSKGRKRTHLREIIRWKKCQKKVIIRAINLYSVASKDSFYHRLLDRQIVKALNMADGVIFQSEYQTSFFLKAGYRGEHSTVIHNGADEDVFRYVERKPLMEGQKLRLVSASTSDKALKRHDIIARFSELDGVEVFHIGKWPNDLDKKNVVLLGKMDHMQMNQHFASVHFFLHPAIKDSCPNVLFEAMLTGLPIIYNPDTGSSSEIVGENGVALDENNLVKTISQCRERYASLLERVRMNRGTFSSKNAISQYISAIQSVLGQHA